MAGIVKLYQIGRYGKPDFRKETVYYFDLKDRKRIVDGWFNFYGAGMANHYIQVAPDANLKLKTK